MLRKFVIQVETTEENQDQEDALSDLKTFRGALEDGSLLECAGRRDPDGRGYPELKHLKVGVIHELEPKENSDEQEEKKEEEGRE